MDGGIHNSFSVGININNLLSAEFPDIVVKVKRILLIL